MAKSKCRITNVRVVDVYISAEKGPVVRYTLTDDNDHVFGSGEYKTFDTRIQKACAALISEMQKCIVGQFFIDPDLEEEMAAETDQPTTTTLIGDDEVPFPITGSKGATPLRAEDLDTRELAGEPMDFNTTPEEES